MSWWLFLSDSRLADWNRRRVWTLLHCLAYKSVIFFHPWTYLFLVATLAAFTAEVDYVISHLAAWHGLYRDLVLVFVKSLCRIWNSRWWFTAVKHEGTLHTPEWWMNGCDCGHSSAEVTWRELSRQTLYAGPNLARQRVYDLIISLWMFSQKLFSVILTSWEKRLFAERHISYLLIQIDLSRKRKHFIMDDIFLVSKERML